MRKIIIIILLLFIVLYSQAQFINLNEYGLRNTTENIHIVETMNKLRKTQRIGSIMAISGLASAFVGYIVISTTIKPQHQFQYTNIIRGDEFSAFLLYGGLSSMIIGFPMWIFSARRLEYYNAVVYLKTISQPINGDQKPIPTISLNINF